MKTIISLLFGSFLLFPTLLSAEQVASNTQLEEFNDFSGGLNTAIDAEKLIKNTSPSMSNVVIDEIVGRIVKRRGSIVTANLGNLTGINSVIVFNKPDGTQEILLANSSTVYKTPDFSTFTVIISSLTSNVKISFTQAYDKIWGSNSIDPVFTYDGSTVVVLNGTGNTPNVPRAKYLSYYKGRVFAYNINNDSTGLAFSNVSSTNGTIINPDDPLAWPGTNLLHVDRGGGYQGTGLFTFKDKLLAFTPNSISYLAGTDETNYQISSVVSGVGAVAGETIAYLDSHLWFLGQDGIYAFDGNEAHRISDSIRPDVEAFNKAVGRTGSIIYDTQPDFLTNATLLGTTTTVTGEIILDQSGHLSFPYSQIQISGGGPESEENYFQGSLSSGTVAMFGAGGATGGGIPSIPLDTREYAIQKILLAIRSIGSNPGPGWQINVGINHLGKNLVSTYTFTASNTYFTYSTASIFALDFTQFANQNIRFTGFELNNSSLSLNIYLTNFTNPSAVVTLGIPWTKSGSSRGGTVVIQPVSSGSYISGISTATSLSAWSTLSVDSNLDTGNIAYYVRVAPSLASITNTKWRSIIPGSVVSTTTSQFVQWASSFTADNSTSVPTINSLTMNYLIGSTNLYPANAFVWKNRYWLSISTAANGMQRIVYVKAKNTSPDANAWMRFDNLPVASFFKFSNLFYAGTSTSSTILQLDFGLNDVGRPIPAYYDTCEYRFSAQPMKKYVQRYLVSSVYNTGTLTIGISFDDGAYTYFSNDTTNASDGTFNYSLNAVNSNGYKYRFRFMNENIDEDLVIKNFNVMYRTTQESK